jgi:hypothetical protein
MQHCSRHLVLLLVLLMAPILLGMGGGGGKDVIQPPVDIHAVLTDRDGTQVDLGRFNIGGRVDIEGEMGRGTLRVGFENIRSIEFHQEDRNRTLATVRLRTGDVVKLNVRNSLTFYGRTPAGIYEVRARDIGKIEFGE